MNKKRILLGMLICLLLVMVCSLRIFQSKNDFYRKAAEEIYGVQTALQEVNEAWKLESISEVMPFEIKMPNCPSIYYYCCITTYLNGSSEDSTELNKAAISQVVDIDAMEFRGECKVGTWNGVMGQLNCQSYLCWTISPQYSCVIEYTAGTVTQEDIFRIAESVEISEE